MRYALQCSGIYLLADRCVHVCKALCLVTPPMLAKTQVAVQRMLDSMEAAVL